MLHRPGRPEHGASFGVGSDWSLPYVCRMHVQFTAQVYILHIYKGKQVMINPIGHFRDTLIPWPSCDDTTLNTLEGSPPAPYVPADF